MAVTWIVVNDTYVRAAMSIPARDAYDAWVTANPIKALRLRAIAVTVVAGFRDGLETNPWLVMDETVDSMPARCVPYALTIIRDHLAIEMNLAATIDVNTQATYLAAEAYTKRGG